MAKILKISDAAAMAMHSMAILAKDADKKMTTREIANILDVSEHHLSKVLQRLTKSGMVNAVRGPRGGFTLSRDPRKVTLLQIYEEFEGELGSDNCLFEHRVCNNNGCMDRLCILGDLISYVTAQVKDYLSETRLSDVIDISFKQEEIE